MKWSLVSFLFWQGKPQRLPKGSRVSQINVAREAGHDPSALKKARFPVLVMEIQNWAEEHISDAPPSPRQMLLARRSRARDLRSRIEAPENQRDDALDLLVQAEARIVDRRKRASQGTRPANVTPIRPAETAGCRSDVNNNLNVTQAEC